MEEDEEELKKEREQEEENLHKLIPTGAEKNSKTWGKAKSSILPVTVSKLISTTPSAGGNLKHDTSKNAAPVATTGNAWKLILAKYIKMTNREMQLFGIVNDSEEDAGAGEAEVNEDMLGTHFLEVPSLYVSYVYVCTAAKIFECRPATREFQESAPDFTIVYHLVIDVIDNYNDALEREAKVEMEKKTMELMQQSYKDSLGAPKLTYKEQQDANKAAAAGGDHSPTHSGSSVASPAAHAPVTAPVAAPTPAPAPAPAPTLSRRASFKAAASAVMQHANENKAPAAAATAPAAATATSPNTSTKRLLFMSDAEKKNDLLIKQRAELAAKKILKELNPDTIKRLSNEAISDLERELLKLLPNAAATNNAVAPSPRLNFNITDNTASTEGAERTEPEPTAEAEVASEAFASTSTTTAKGISENEYATELLYILKLSKIIS